MRWAIVIAAWTAIGLLSSAQFYLEQLARENPTTWGIALRLRLPPWYLWALFTPAIFWMGRALPIDRESWRRTLPLHTAIALGVSLVYLALNSLVIAATEGILLTPEWYLGNMARHLTRSLHVYWLMYWMILGVGYLFDLREAAAAERRASQQLREEVTRLAKALQRDTTLPAEAPEYIRRIPVRRGPTILYIDIDSVDWIEAAGHYAELHQGGHTHLVRETMNNLERVLDPSRFVRIHRSRIVNVERVLELHSEQGEESALILRDGSRLSVSRSRREGLRKKLLAGTCTGRHTPSSS